MHSKISHCPPDIGKLLFGGKLIALNEKDGGIRPIAVGYYWRRLAAKCANLSALERVSGIFAPVQLGVGVPGGCEAAIHSTRRFALCMPFKNAFNCIHRDILLDRVAEVMPELYPFCHLAYG